MNNTVKAVALTAFLGLAGLVPAAHAQTAPTPAIPIAECTLTGPGIAVCGGILVAGNELKLMQGKQVFGQNGEIIKAANTVWHDATKGPGDHNDLVRRHGWLRSRLGF